MDLEKLKNQIANLQKELNNKKEVERNSIEIKYSEQLFKMCQEKSLTVWECKFLISNLVEEIRKLEIRY